MSFQSSLEMFQWQFWICNVFGQGVPHSRSGDTEASWPEATCPGSRCGEVSPCRGTKVGARPDYRNGDAGSTEICRLRYVYKTLAITLFCCSTDFIMDPEISVIMSFKCINRFLHWHIPSLIYSRIRYNW